MGLRKFFNRISWSVSIFTGVLFAFLWTFLACYDSSYLFWVHGGRSQMRMREAEDITMFISSIACAAMSVLMVFGVVKRNANYIFPWLAIHFSITLYVVPRTGQTVVWAIGWCGLYEWLYDVLPMILYTIALIFLWGIVCLYCKNLFAPTQVNPICPEKNEEILETSNEPEKQAV